MANILSTDEVGNRLRNDESDDVLDDEEILASLVNGTFPAELAALMEKKNMNASRLSKRCKVSKSYINQLLQPPKSDRELVKRPSKYVVVEMGLELGATEEETNRLLKAAGLKELYARDFVDMVIIRGLAKGESASEIKEALFDRGITVFS